VAFLRKTKSSSDITHPEAAKKVRKITGVETIHQGMMGMQPSKKSKVHILTSWDSQPIDYTKS